MRISSLTNGGVGYKDNQQDGWFFISEEIQNFYELSKDHSYFYVFSKTLNETQKRKYKGKEIDKINGEISVNLMHYKKRGL